MSQGHSLSPMLPLACSASTAATLSPASCSDWLTTVTRPSTRSTTITVAPSCGTSMWATPGKSRPNSASRTESGGTSARPPTKNTTISHSSIPWGLIRELGICPGRLAYAGSRYRPASFGRRHPEINWYHAFSPRLGIAYALTPRTVIRTGYGIFYNQAFYPGWNSGIGQDGFNFTPSFSSTNGGLTPAFTLAQGLPQDFQRPPFIDSALLNGQDGPTYRPFDANRLTYAQQWNLTVDHQFTSDFYISAAYVANKGSRLPSNTSPLNALNPKYLSMGQQLYHEFAPGDTELDGVRVPYQGWVDQMQNCAPSVAQALRPFPQY